MVVYYSGTGNSRIIAERIALKLNDKTFDAFVSIKENREEQLCSEAPWVFVCPTYFYRLPGLFETFLRRCTFSGSRDAYFAMTCGSGIWNAEKQLKTLCPELGLNYRGLKKILMPENYTASFPVPDAKQTEEIIRKALPVADGVAECVAEDRDIPRKKYGLFGHIDNGFLNRTLYKVIVSSKGFHIEGNCVSCGICEKVCPANAVNLSGGKPVWNGNCVHCMACINACPQKAIEYKNISQGKPRIYNGKAN